MRFVTSKSPEFAELKAEVESYPRLSGYYIIDLVAIPGFPDHDADRENLLDELFQHFDDRDWPPPRDRPTDQTWDDYERDRQVAADHAVEALIGGPQIGHTAFTIGPAKALEFWNRFESLFSEPRHYYTGMGFGDPEHVFLHGAVIIDNHKAGILWIVESD